MIRTEDELRTALKATIETERLDHFRRMIADLGRPVPLVRRRWVTPLVAAATVAALAAGTVTAIALSEGDRATDPTPAATTGFHPSPTAAGATSPVSGPEPIAPPLPRRLPTAAVQSHPSSARSTTPPPAVGQDVAPRVGGKAQARTTYFTLDPASGFKIGPTGVTSNTAEIRNILLADGSQSGAAVDMEGPGDIYGLAKTAGAPAVPLSEGVAHWATYRNFRYGTAAVQVLLIDLTNGDQAMVVSGGTSPASRSQAVEIATALRPGTISSHDLPAVFSHLPDGYTYGGSGYQFGPDGTAATGDAQVGLAPVGAVSATLMVQFSAPDREGTTEVPFPATSGASVSLGGRTWQWNSGHTVLVSKGSDCTIGVGAVDSTDSALGGPLPAGIDESEIKRIADGLRLHSFGDQSTWLPVPGQ